MQALMLPILLSTPDQNVVSIKTMESRKEAELGNKIEKLHELTGNFGQVNNLF